MGEYESNETYERVSGRRDDKEPFPDADGKEWLVERTGEVRKFALVSERRHWIEA